MVLLLVVVSHGRLRAVNRIQSKAAAMLHEVAVVDSERERRMQIASLNEMTLDVKYVLGRSRDIPRSCARTAFAFGALVAIVSGAEALSGEGGNGWAVGLGGFAAGGVAAVACSLIGRRADQKARELREEWNSLIRRSTRDVPTYCGSQSCVPAVQLIP